MMSGIMLSSELQQLVLQHQLLFLHALDLQGIRSPPSFMASIAASKSACSCLIRA